MAFEFIRVDGYSEENLGAGGIVTCFGLKNMIMPKVKNGNAYGGPTPGDNYLQIRLHGVYTSYTATSSIKNGITIYNHLVSLKIPRIDAAKIEKLVNVMDNRFIVRYNALNSVYFNGVANPQVRLIGDEDNSCKLEFKEIYGAKPQDFNHVMVEFTCVTDHPAYFEV